MAHHSNHPHHHQHEGGKQTPIHKDWRTWTAILLMLGGMLIYIFTMDESEGPGGQPQEAMGDADAE